MIYQGHSISVDSHNHIAQLTFDRAGESVNTLNQRTLKELQEAIEAIRKTSDIRGLLICSNKQAFIVGADITEFGELFDGHSEQSIVKRTLEINTEIFNRIEDLPFPSVTAINGLALGGGLELSLCTDFRVMAEDSKIGFPEVTLGIIPGYGGTVRTPRLIGSDNAIEWISSGKHYDANAALSVGMVDAVTAPSLLKNAALDLLLRCNAGEFNYQSIRQQKSSPVLLDDTELLMTYTSGKALVAQQSPKGMIAPLAAVNTMEQHAKLGRDEALNIEATQVAKLAKSKIARNLTQLFLGNQQLLKTAKSLAKQQRINQAAVLGAGIMGGGVAYQSAITGTPIILKDIAQAGIDTGMAEASRLLAKAVNGGQMSPETMATTLNKISPTLSYEHFDKVELVVEAIIENPIVKKTVLAELESVVHPTTIITTNTSTITITELASALTRPQNFCGMHFFNPVQKMPLVEIIRGEKTSQATINKAVSYALALGKKPVVVNDGPGFLVNRILFAYLSAFIALLQEGADFVAIDKAAEKFGWPMGPAYLSDVVGIDTGVHAGAVMAAGFPDRMKHSYKTVLEVLLENNRLGKKNGGGFYHYEVNKNGKTIKTEDDIVRKLLAPYVSEPREFSAEEIIERMMIPLCLESIRCLEDKIANNATELDIALIYGLGFPSFHGGAIRYIENMGLTHFCNIANKYAAFGPLYQTTERLREMAAHQKSYFN